MIRGALLFAYNNDTCNYFKQAEITACRINHFLNLPVTLVTDENSLPENPLNVFDRIILTEPNKSNKKFREVWINKNRYRAYELSPYDETLLLDTDYVINSDKLLQIFKLYSDFCCYNTTNFLMTENKFVEHLSQFSYKTDWATVVYFRKTKKCRQIFECMKMIQDNYLHYANLHNFLVEPFRNDYALTLARRIVQGQTEVERESIPWSLTHIGDKTKVYKTNSNFFDTEFLIVYDKWMNGKIKKEYISIKDYDFHLMDKENFMELWT